MLVQCQRFVEIKTESCVRTVFYCIRTDVTYTCSYWSVLFLRIYKNVSYKIGHVRSFHLSLWLLYGSPSTSYEKPLEYW